MAERLMGTLESANGGIRILHSVLLAILLFLLLYISLVMTRLEAQETLVDAGETNARAAPMTAAAGPASTQLVCPRRQAVAAQGTQGGAADTYGNIGPASVSDVLSHDQSELNIVLYDCNLEGGILSENLVASSAGGSEAGEQMTILCSVVTDTGSNGALLGNTAGMKRNQTDNAEDCERMPMRPGCYKLVIEPGTREASALPGSSVVYTFTVTNYGSGVDHVGLEVTSLRHWCVITHIVDPDLYPQEFTSLFVTVTVPGNAQSSHYDQATVVARSLDPEGDSSAIITTTVEPSACIAISPGTNVVIPPSQAHGCTVTFTHTISNCGNGTDRVTVVVSSTAPLWLKPSPSYFTKTIKAWSSIPVVISGTIWSKPVERVSSGDLMVKAASGVDDSEEDVAVNTVYVKQFPGVTISPGHEQEVCASVIATCTRSLTYVHALANTGNDSDRFTVTQHSSAGWYVDPAPRTIGPIPAGDSREFVVTVTVPGEVGEGVDNTWVAVTSWFSNAVTASARNTTTVRPCKAFLPMILEKYPVFCNGDFETGDLNCWIKYEALKFPVKVVEPSTDPDYNCFHTYAVRIGRSGQVPDGEVLTGHFGISQTVVVADVPYPKLEFDYCMYSYDMIRGPISGRIYDTFEVAVDNPNVHVWRTGNPGLANGRDLWESERQHASIDLSAYSGEAVTIYFSVWNRVFPEWNTWAYIDNIDGDFIKFRR